VQDAISRESVCGGGSHTNHDCRRLGLALLLSLLAHALLMSLTLGGDQLGLPGFAFPWLEHRVAVPDLRVALLPPPVANVAPSVTPDERPLPRAWSEQFAPAKPDVISSSPPEPTLKKPGMTLVNRSAPADKQPSAPKAKPKAKPAPAKAGAKAPRPPKPVPSVIALEESESPEFVVPETSAEPTPANTKGAGEGTSEAITPERVTPEPGDAGVPAQKSIDQPMQAPVAESATPDQSAQARQQAAAGAESARLEAERLLAARQEAARQEAERQNAAQQAVARQEAGQAEIERQQLAQQEAARQAAEKLETARQEAVRQNAVQQAAARQEAIRQELARKEAAAREAAAREAAAREAAAREAAAREAAAREAAAREAAARESAAREAAARESAAREFAVREATAHETAARELAGRQEAARADEAIREQNARRDAARRAMGRQLDEEADRRDAARAASRLSPSAGYLRRGRLFGRIDSNAELVKYAEAVSRKIHFNSASDAVFALAKNAHNPPMVTVAIRSDGSVESVTFVASSGVPAIDDAIRRIVQSQALYPPFPPGLTRDYDVLEIRRTWHIDTAIRLY
jgi:membrane protein involved in colicin uptake